MSARPLPESKSVDRAAFDHYLRTGERFTNEEWLTRECKFNPYHDEVGRFTSSPGVTVSYGDQAARMTAMRRADEWLRGSTGRPDPSPPKPAANAPPSANAPRPARQAATSPRTSNRAAPISPPVKNLLAQMTLREVDELQTRILNHPANTLDASPVGKYQIVRQTLRDLKVKLRLSDNMIFDSNLQDMLGMAELRSAGLQNYMDGKISASDFQFKIAKKWASVADPRTGRPRLSRQHLGTTTAQIAPLIQALRRR